MPPALGVGSAQCIGGKSCRARLLPVPFALARRGAASLITSGLLGLPIELARSGFVSFGRLRGHDDRPFSPLGGGSTADASGDDWAGH